MVLVVAVVLSEWVEADGDLAFVMMIAEELECLKDWETRWEGQREGSGWSPRWQKPVTNYWKLDSETE